MNLNTKVLALFVLIIGCLISKVIHAEQLFEESFYKTTLGSSQQLMKHHKINYTVDFKDNASAVNVKEGNPFTSDPILGKLDSFTIYFDNHENLFVFSGVHNSQNEEFSKSVIEKVTKIYGSPKIGGANKNLQYEFENKESLVTVSVMEMSDMMRSTSKQIAEKFKQPHLADEKKVYPEHYAVRLKYKKKA